MHAKVHHSQRHKRQREPSREEHGVSRTKDHPEGLVGRWHWRREREDAWCPTEILYRTTPAFKNAEETKTLPDAVNLDGKEELPF